MPELSQLKGIGFQNLGVSILKPNWEHDTKLTPDLSGMARAQMFDKLSETLANIPSQVAGAMKERRRAKTEEEERQRKKEDQEYERKKREEQDKTDAIINEKIKSGDLSNVRLTGSGGAVYQEPKQKSAEERQMDIKRMNLLDRKIENEEKRLEGKDKSGHDRLIDEINAMSEVPEETDGLVPSDTTASDLSSVRAPVPTNASPATQKFKVDPATRIVTEFDSDGKIVRTGYPSATGGTIWKGAADKTGKTATQIARESFARQGVVLPEDATPDEIEAARSKIKPVVEHTDPDVIAEAIINGDQPPTLQGLYKLGAPVRSALAKKGYDLTTATQDWEATKRHVASLEGPQQLRLRQAVDFTYHSLELIEGLGAEWKGGNYPALNKARLIAAKQGALGPEAQSLAQRLDAQINDLVSELGTVYKGGNSTTDHTLRLAAENLKADFSEKTLNDSIKMLRSTLSIRANSLKNIPPVSPRGGVNQYGPKGTEEAASAPIKTKAQQAEEWLAQHPDDPRAPLIRAKLKVGEIK